MSLFDRSHWNLMELVDGGLVVVGDAGRIVEVNRAAEDLVGRERAGLRGLPLAALFAGDDPMPRILAEPLARLRVRVRRPGGAELDAELEARAPFDGWRPLLLRRLADAAEGVRSEALQEALDCLPRAVVVWDAHERLVACNAGFRSSFPRARVGMPSSEVLDALEPSAAVPLDGLRSRVTRDGRREHFEIDLPMRDGRTLRVVSRPTADGGRIAIVLDATEMLRRERELVEARDAAEQASRTKTEFVAALSHELRTPLQSLLGYAELLRRNKREPLSAGQRSMLERLLRSGALVQRLLDDALDLARIETQVVTLDLQDVSLEALLVQVREILAVAASERGVSLHLPAGAHPTLRADALRLAEIFLNFGSNAIKYNRPGGWVRFTASEDDEYVQVTVSDSGLGVPHAERDRLFRPFHRAGRENGSVPGTGIGLAIAARLAREMGGEVGYAPERGGGSAFWVRLPRAAGSPAARESGVRERTVGSGLSGVRILYLTDDPARLSFVTGLLESLEVGVLGAPSLREGVGLARTERPDLVLIELRSDGAFGVAALRVLRSDVATADIPALAISDAVSVTAASSALVAGFAALVSTPVKLPELASAIRAALAHRRARSA